MAGEQGSSGAAVSSASESEAASAGETATGPVKGIVATRSATGTKTDTPLIETPQSISVITADRIDQQGATSVSEALGYTAGVRGSVYGVDTRFDWLNIRGFNAYLPGFFVDGLLARNNNTWAVWKVEPYGAERIEVLKGPPSVLYGQANAGGMLNVVSKRPLDEAFNEVEQRVGSHNRLESLFDFSGPATENGKVLYRLTGVVLDTDTQVDFTEQQRIFIAPAVTFRPNADTSLTVLGQYLKEDDVPNIGFLPPEGTVQPGVGGQGPIPRSFFTGEPGYDNFQLEQWSVGYLLEHRFDEVRKARQNLRYREMTIDYQTLYGTGMAPDPADPNSGYVLTRNAFTSDETVAAFTVDNQLQADFVYGGIRHTVLAGVDFQNSDFTHFGTIGAAPSIDPYRPVYGQPVPTNLTPYVDADTTIRQTGVYVQEQAKIDDHWIVTLGGRQDWAQTDITDPINGNSSNTDQAFTWKAGVLYHASNGLAPYFNYSESFFPQAGVDGITRAPFSPETGQQYEAGIKYQPLGMRGLFTFAAFDITRQNYVTFDQIGQSRQIGEIHSQGIELEATTELAPGLDLIAAYTWLPEFEITKSSNSAEVGKREVPVPEHMASLWLHYRLPNGPLAGFGFGGGVRYIGESYGDVLNTAENTTPDYTLLDGVIDYEADGWRFAINVSNITDETTITCDDTCFYGAGRTIIASVRHRW